LNYNSRQEKIYADLIDFWSANSGRDCVDGRWRRKGRHEEVGQSGAGGSPGAPADVARRWEERFGSDYQEFVWG